MPEASEKLMIVDDEAGLRKVLSISLADRGYIVSTAASGQEALELFRREQPSIVLTDIKMPGMTGIELLEQIKTENPDTEVIMITGHGDMAIAIESLKLNATDFITKPIREDTLDIALKRACERIAMRRKLQQYTENLEALVQEKSARLIKAERVAAVSKVFEGLSSAIWNLAGDLKGGIAHFDEMPCLVAVHNAEKKIVAVNQLFQERLGDRTGSGSWEIYRGESGTPDNCPVARTISSGVGQRSQEVVEYRSGTEVPVIVHTSPVRSVQGETELVLEIAADISEVKRLQQQLSSTQQRYQQLFDEVPCYITVQDGHFRLKAANRQFKEDFDYETNAHCYRVYKNRESVCPDCPVEKTFEDGLTHQSEMVVTAKDGEQYNVLISTAPIRNSVGDVTQVMEMSTNITQIRKLQDHLSALGLKIGTISHGIKGLLTGLDGGMYLVETGFTKENQQKIQEGWETVKLMVSRIRSMILDILFYAKERELQWEKVDVLSFAQDVATTITTKMKRSNIQFFCRFDPEAREAEIDPGVVRSALISILENAAEACLEDRSGKPKEVIFGVRQDRKYIFFDVQDNGIGMSRKMQDKLFTLFHSSKGKHGTGLGLFFARKIIDQHGGSITVDSSPRKGSRFCVKIPRMPAAFLKSGPEETVPE